MRAEIGKEIDRIEPLDQIERAAKTDVLSWIDYGLGICRLKKPDVPPKHLASYFLLVDGDPLLPSNTLV